MNNRITLNNNNNTPNKPPPTPQMPFSPNINNPTPRRATPGILSMQPQTNPGQTPSGQMINGMKSPFRGGSTPSNPLDVTLPLPNHIITTPTYGTTITTPIGNNTSNMGIVGMVDDEYSSGYYDDTKLYHKPMTRVDSNMVGAKGTTQVQLGVRQQYEESIPELVMASQREMDLTSEQLQHCSEHLTTQIEQLDRVQAEKIVPTLFHQLAVIYRAPLPDVKNKRVHDNEGNNNSTMRDRNNNNNHANNNGFDIHSFDPKTTMKRAGDQIKQMNEKITSLKGQQNEIVTLHNYMGNKNHLNGTNVNNNNDNDDKNKENDDEKHLIVTGNNLAEVVSTMISFRHHGFELSPYDLEQLQQTLKQEYHTAIVVDSRK